QDALARARALAPGDPTIAALLDEADGAIAMGGGQRGGDGFSEFGEVMTKHYPSHRGAGTPDPTGSVRAAGAISAAAARAIAAAERARDRAAAPGYDASGTGEIDPDLEGGELGRDDADEDEPVEPPPPRAATQDVGDLDVVEVEARDLIGGGGRVQMRGRSFVQPEYIEEATIAEPAPAGLADDPTERGREDTPPPEPRPGRAQA